MTVLVMLIEKQNSRQMLLNNLPAELLSKILGFLDKEDLVNICQVCKQLRKICLDDLVWRSLGQPLANFRPNHFRQLRKLFHGRQESISSKNSLKEACRIAHNWQSHKPYDCTVQKFRQKLLPWLCFSGNALFFSHLNSIISSRTGSRFRNGIDFKHRRYYRGHKSDVVRFAVTDSQIISGGCDRQILVWNKDSCDLYQQIPLEGIVTSLDACNSTIVTGIRERGISVFRKNEHGFVSSYHYPMKDIVWTLAVDTNNRYFTAGSSCCLDKQPLKVFDVERGDIVNVCGKDYPYGAGVLALHYQDPRTFLSCGYDCSLNCWDLRGSCRVPSISFPDEDQSFYYSLDSDHDNFIACGLCRFGQIKFWDKRHPSRNVQSFFVGNVGRLDNSSPVYSLKVTATHLYAALSQSLQTLDFTHNLCYRPDR